MEQAAQQEPTSTAETAARLYSPAEVAAEVQRVLQMLADSVVLGIVTDSAESAELAARLVAEMEARAELLTASKDFPEMPPEAAEAVKAEVPRLVLALGRLAKFG